MKRIFFAIAAVFIVFAGFDVHASAKNDSSASWLMAPTETAADPHAEATEDANMSLSGKVVETMNSGGYTYAHIEKNGKRIWVAIPVTELKVGQQVTFQPGSEMENFTSKTLKRTFDKIVFSTGLETKATAGGKKQVQHKTGAKQSAGAPAKKIKVQKAAGPDAYTVSEIHDKAAALNQKNAVVRGQVVKVSQAIMGKNWIHIQDGTGDASRANDKLVVTSKELPAVGDVITMKGTIYKDKDFGAGYKYSVIMEEATIQR